jgi:DNA-binding GntR family transcriptional regulator
MMRPLTRPETLTEAVARHIRDAIVRGEFPPGSALPEVRLADRLGTSRGTVREALRALEDQGLVEIFPHKGSFVSRMTKRRAREVYELRSILESHAARLAVERGAFSGEGRTSLEDRLRDLETAAEHWDPMALIEAERALHREIWSRCDNDLLKDYLATLQVQTRRLLIYNKVFTTPADEEVAMHRQLVETVLSGDPEAAAAAVRDHVRASADFVLGRMSED